MTEYELSDLMNGITSNVIQGQVVFLTTLTAYLVVAYTVGAKLTRYQVSFVNFAFLLFNILGIQAQLYNLDQVYDWGAQIFELRGESLTLAGEASRWVFISIRLIMLAGSLAFMWQIRHPKTE